MTKVFLDAYIPFPKVPPPPQPPNSKPRLTEGDLILKDLLSILPKEMIITLYQKNPRVAKFMKEEDLPNEIKLLEL